MKNLRTSSWAKALMTALALMLLIPCLATAQEEEDDYTTNFGRERCNFTSTGSNPYYPLWPGYALHLEGEEEDDEGELVDIAVTITVLHETELVNGVVTRVVEEYEEEDGEVVEISRNFVAVCRETGDVWYFGEDVDDYEDGEIVGHEGAWRAGVNGARPGLLMPGTPFVGARYYEEIAPGVAEDRVQITSVDEEATVPAGTYEDLVATVDSEGEDEKLYAPGVGLIVDEDLELIEITPPACVSDDTTHCLNGGRFMVHAAWKDFEGKEGDGIAILPSDESGEFWFFNSSNTELVVKVLNGCDLPSNAYWVFAAGLTNVEVELTVTDTLSGQTWEYENPLRQAFMPVLDTQAFATCP